MIALALLLGIVPPEINYIVQFRAYVGGRPAGSFACPVATDRLLTAAHTCDGPFGVWEARDRSMGIVVRLYQHKTKDLLMLRPASRDENLTMGENLAGDWWSKPFLMTLRYSKKRPASGENVFYVGNIPGSYAVVVVGRVLGYDEDGALQIDGWAHPGCSGSGVLNGSGELVGIICGTANWAAPVPNGLSLYEMIEALRTRALFRPTVFAEDVVGGWPKE